MYQIPLDIRDINLPPKAFGSRCYVHSTPPNQVCGNGANVLVRYDTVRWDLLGEFDNTVGTYAFTPSEAGIYEIHPRIFWMASAGGGQADLYIYVNGVWRATDTKVITANIRLSQDLRLVDYFTDVDAISVRVVQTCGVAKTIMHQMEITYLIIRRIG